MAVTLADPARSTAATDLMARLGHDFDDPELLTQALTHRSWCAEHAGYASNERLEFLGDAVLGLVVTDHIFRTYPELHEGALAKLRARVVSAPVLAEVGDELGLGAVLRLGKGEDASGGRTKQSILADAFEAVIGALFLDGGPDEAARLVLDRLGGHIVDAAAGPGGHDHKTQLQELVARRAAGVLSYAVTDEGPDHDKVFHATVAVDGAVVGTGSGRSKKLAEQDAAAAALVHLRVDGGGATGEGTDA